MLVALDWVWLAMVDSGSMMLFESKSIVAYSGLCTFADELSSSRAPLLTGEDGRRLQQKAWHEIVTALSKDVPEVSNLVRV